MSGLPARGPAIAPFHAGQIGRRALRLQSEGRRVIPMHFGQPTAGAPPSAIAAAEAALRTNASGYWESLQLRARIAQHYLDTQAVVVEPSRILLTNGASAGLVALFTALFAPGDCVGVGRPGYPAYRNALLALGRRPIDIDGVQEDGYRVKRVALEQCGIALQGLVVASPSNPTGSVLKDHEFEAIVDFCKERRIRLVSDEIYHGLSFDHEPRTALALDPDAVVVNSFSKFFRMPGWRLGWIVVPESLAPTVSAHLTNFFLTPSTISQHAALGAFDDLDELRSSVEVYRRNSARLVDAMPGMGIDSFIVPEGAFYLYVDLSNLTDDSLAFCGQLLEETGVSTAPGIDFDSQRGHRRMRFSYALSPDQLDEAVDILTPWFASRPTIRAAAYSR